METRAHSDRKIPYNKPYNVIRDNENRRCELIDVALLKIIVKLTFKNGASHIQDRRTASLQMLIFIYIYFYKHKY
jgi:hypothetical protein